MFGDLVRATSVTAELLDRDDQPLGVELTEQARSEIDLGVEGVVVGHDRHAGLGDLAVVLDDDALVGAVGVGWQQHDGYGTGLRCLLGPAA